MSERHGPCQRDRVILEHTEAGPKGSLPQDFPRSTFSDTSASSSASTTSGSQERLTRCAIPSPARSAGTFSFATSRPAKGLFPGRDRREIAQQGAGQLLRARAPQVNLRVNHRNAAGHANFCHVSVACRRPRLDRRDSSIQHPRPSSVHWLRHLPWGSRKSLLQLALEAYNCRFSVHDIVMPFS